MFFFKCSMLSINSASQGLRQLFGIKYYYMYVHANLWRYFNMLQWQNNVKLPNTMIWLPLTLCQNRSPSFLSRDVSRSTCYHMSEHAHYSWAKQRWWSAHASRHKWAGCRWQTQGKFSGVTRHPSPPNSSLLWSFWCIISFKFDRYLSLVVIIGKFCCFTVWKCLIIYVNKWLFFCDLPLHPLGSTGYVCQIRVKVHFLNGNEP